MTVVVRIDRHLRRVAALIAALYLPSVHGDRDTGPSAGRKQRGDVIGQDRDRP
ncbi:hypothetical protein [Streptomyces sp. NPDC048277]|uniref:hypothetical protein n=1 Tax=Streptomyces sp. NPDC048277 TaxID=3155027 RepID=UPI003410FF26